MEDKKDYGYGWCLFMNYKGLLERYYFKTEKEQKECKTKIYFTDEEEREVTKYIGLK